VIGGDHSSSAGHETREDQRKSAGHVLGGGKEGVRAVHSVGTIRQA